MQNSILISDAQVRPAGISVEEGMKALKCEIRKLAKTKSETFSYLCEETVTYGEVVMTMAGFFAFMAAAVLGGFIMGGDVVMAKIDMLTDVAERLAEYKMFYPDATITRVGFEDCNSISHEDGLKLSEQVCHMTHSGLLQFVIFKNRMYIFKSREFLKVAAGFKKGARVRFHDPRTPDDHRESVMLADGMRYDGGIPFIWTEDSDADCFMECNTFAVYWRPVEEMSEK